MEKKKKKITPEQDALRHIVACRDKPFLEERYIDSLKGKGVFTHKAIEPSTFVVEYRGNVFSYKDTRPRKKHDDALNNYLFEFTWKGAQWCLDASTEDGSLGRLVNDDHRSPNCEMKTVVYKGKPHLCLFALKEISPGEEITYDYGDSSYPWRSRGSHEGLSTSCTDVHATSSTPRNDGHEDSEAASSCDNPSSDDDDEPPDSAPSHENDRDSLPLKDLDSSQEMTRPLSLQPDDTSSVQQEDVAASISSESSCSKDHRPRKATRKTKQSSFRPRNYCYVCGAGFAKIARHLLRHADEEPDIAKAFALPQQSEERRKLLYDLRNRGNYKHNQEVLRNKSGELKPRRRSSIVSAKTHAHCPHCKGMFKRKDLWRHVARVHSMPMSNTATGGKTRVLSEIALAESPFSKKISSTVWKMLVNMKQDEIAYAIQNDFLLIQLAQHLSEKYRKNADKHEFTRQRLREMGRLLIALHEKSIFSFEEAIKPKNFNKVVDAVKDMAGYDEKMKSYNKPSLALKLGHSLKKIAATVLSGVDGNEQMMRDTKTFMKLCVQEWSERVSQTAVASLGGRKVNNPSTIPFTRDVQVFYRYLETTSTYAIESLLMSENPQVYNALCRVTLAQVSILNKCAPEVSKMTVTTFQERGDTTQVLSKHFIRINILSRNGQSIAVLLTSELVSALTLLVSKREACGVHQDNPFLFAKPNSSSTSLFHGGNCIRAFSSLCRAKNPEHLRSVHLRKHIARVFQILNLENDELFHLAALLGHTIQADRDYYRLPEAAVELAKIAKLLLAMEKGSLEKFKGNSLEEIEIEDELEPDVEQSDPENSDVEEDSEESDSLLQQSKMTSDTEVDNGYTSVQPDAVEQQGVMEKERRQLTPEQDAIEHITSCRDKPFLEEMIIDCSKGRGVFTRESIEPSTFVVEYRGNIISQKEIRKKKLGDTLTDYLFDFSWNGKRWRVDASKEDGSLGRLVNDDHISPNCEMKKIVCKRQPHLCLFAVRKISPGEEITYNYGNSSYPWRSGKSSEELNTSQPDRNSATSSPQDENVVDSAGASSSAESSCDEYIPEAEPSSDDSSTSKNNQQCQNLKNSPDPSSSDQQSFVQQPNDAPCVKQEDEADDSPVDFTSDEEPEELSFSRKNYCYVCGKAYFKISRHLFTHKKEEADIAEAFSLPPNSKERNRLLNTLRNRGNYKHNEEVLKTHRGELKVRRRRKPDKSTSSKTFALCLYCKCMFSRKDMWRHVQRCSSKKASNSSIQGKTKVLTFVDAAESTNHKEILSDVSKLLKQLKKDEIATVVCNDTHILQLAQYMCHVNADKPKKCEYIKQKLRLMGRLLLTLRGKSVCSFEDAVKPQNFSKVVEAVEEIAEFNEQMKSCHRPSLMGKLVTSLKKIGDINYARALKEDADEQTIQEAETFMKLCADKWSNVPPSNGKMQSTIPFTRDVQLLYQCMEDTADSAVESLTKYESPPVYTALLRVTVAQVAVLNKKLEASQVTLKSFNERDETELREDAAVCQSQFDQFLNKHTVKINLLTNKGKKVEVTLTPKLLSAITLLVSKREACGVHKDNPFLFARPVAISISFYQGHHCIKTFVARCGAKNLRSMFFRQHIARVFQILSFTNEDLDQLAKLMGRDIRTDREYYQMPQAVVDIAKISELLSAMENGTFERYEGKSLEEMEIADELEPVVEQDSPESSDAEGGNEESESSPQKRVSISATKKASRGSSSGKRGGGRSRRRKSENQGSELDNKKKDEVNTEKVDGSEEEPVSCDVKTPKATESLRNENATKMSFSDDDEDMNVDFDMDIDTDEDIARNEENDGDGATNEGNDGGATNEGNDGDGATNGSVAMPLSCDVNTPKETLSHRNEDATKMSFSDDDEDMNVDFDMDIDTDEDIVRNEENNEDEGTMPLTSDVEDTRKQDSPDTKRNNSSPNKHTTATDIKEAMDNDTVNRVEKKNQNKGGDPTKLMDVDSRRSSAILNTEKKNKLSAAVTGMKEVKILIPKLDIEKLRAPIHISQLSSVCNSVKQPVKDQPFHEVNTQCPTSSTSTNSKNEPNYAKALQMTCSHCKKCMMKGQTAYQKKGFTDVFCSKNCLFELFPVNKPATKTCHYCHKAISQPLDIIMAAVDMKGTMKDFCSVICLSSFKSNSVSTEKTQSICSMCNKSCTVTHELTLNETIHKFCCDSCVDDFCREKMAICENCKLSCQDKPLKLELEEETKTICSNKCLDEFKKKIKTSHLCTMCHDARLVSDMILYKSDDNIVELFCTRTCLTSYRLRPAIVYKLQGKRSSTQSKKRKREEQSSQQLHTEDVDVTSDSTVNENGASPAAESNTPTLIIANMCVVCSNCGDTLPKGQTLYQPKNSPEVFCSTLCLSERHPHIKLNNKKCYNCSEVIMRPHNMILAPVDDSGTMKELCSDTCLSSVNSKRVTASPKLPPPAGPRFECRMCARFCFCKFRLRLDGVTYKLCSDACFINYHKVNNLPVFTCDICSSVCTGNRLMLKTEDVSGTVCSEECLAKFKEKITTPQLCPMCQTFHQMSDMVEKKTNEGRLDFFCSNRCIMVHEAQSLTVSGKTSPTYDENDVKEVKLLNLDCIKQEPINEEYNQSLSPSISTEAIKVEPNVAKEDLRIGSVFSLTEDSKSTAPTLTHMDLPASCSSCKKALMDGETVYQRKGHADIFCSSSCLLKFYQMKQAKKTCHFCLQAITQHQDVLQFPVDNNETMKDFCSQTCLSSFNYKRITSTKLPITPVASHSQCSICSRYCISKHEVIQQDIVHKICSDPCFLRFCNMNKLSICENCHSHCTTSTPVMLKLEDGSKKLCSAECLAQFKQKIKTPQPCAMCSAPRLMSDMVESKNSQEVVELFCTSSCVMASKIKAVNASGVPLNCDNCEKTTLPACHLAMSDASIRNFCTLTCAMAFKESQNAATNSTGASDQTQCDFLKPPEKLPCAQCRRILKTAPKVIQKKGKMNFVCSLACSQEFKRVNNIMGKCEYCKNERIINDVKKVDGKDCYFCSDGCKMLFRHELEEQWGKHCHSCAYCLSISKTVVTAQYKGAEEEFCSEECNSNYKMLFCHVAKCDTCGHEGKLRQSLPMLGEVKHFCDLKCLLHFCNKKVQMVNTAVSSPPRSAGTAEPSPVIANVISLAGALARQSSASASSAQYVSVPDIQTKVVGHASVQTIPKELKNKSMLCTPLVHNKGVSCTTLTTDTEAQTDNFVPKVIVLPLPVPVYVPLPLNMYSQYTPKPVGLPLPLPVPMFLSVTSDSPEPTEKSMKERIQSEPLKGELDLKSELEKTQDKKKENETKIKVLTKDGQRQEIHTQKEHTNNRSKDADMDHSAPLNSQEDSFSDTRYESLTRPHSHKKTPPVLEMAMANKSPPELPHPAPPALEMREDPQSSQNPVEVPSPSQQTVGKVHKKNKGRKPLHLSKAVRKETFQRDFSKTVSRKHHKLKSQGGIDAWKRWIQWRGSLTNLDCVSSLPVTLSEDILRCSATELSDCLCCFITEVKRPDGKSYSPDSLFYLCLSIQQYLFENGRLENIFSDLIYNKFSVKFTKILKGFKPTVTASGESLSHVEEEFLWDCKQLGAYSPFVLLNTLLFFCCKYFGFTTVEQHRQLSFSRIECCTRTNQNHTKTSFLRFYPPTYTDESDADSVPAKKRKKNESKEDILEMMENTENPLRCPVRLYEFYLSKCSESVRQRTDLFYLHPIRYCQPTSHLWFSSIPLDNSTMEAMLVRILTVREMQGEGRILDQQMSDDTQSTSDMED